MEGLACETRTKSSFTEKKLVAHCGASYSCPVTFFFHRNDFVSNVIQMFMDGY